MEARIPDIIRNILSDKSKNTKDIRYKISKPNLEEEVFYYNGKQYVITNKVPDHLDLCNLEDKYGK